MSKGRKADAGTYEARDYVTSIEFEQWINTPKISQDAKDRIKKAVLFGLGVKSPEEYAQQKADRIAKMKAELAELEGKTTPIKEKAITKTKKQTVTNDNGDVYFASEDCKPVN